jgi:sterol desaturase/sphingolipid hydroxylase (fatty acid hydroxylase superfamily)
MWVAILISAAAMTVIVAVRYLITSGLFAWATKRVRPGLYDGMEAQIGKEIRWSLASAAIYGVPAGIVAWGWQNRGWTQIYTDFAAYPLWYLPLSVFAFLLAHDTWFYWTHRWMHRPRWFRIAHKVHHDSKPPTAWTAMSFHPIEAITGAVVIPLLIFVIPIHVAMLGLVLTIMTIMGITNHMGWEMFPRALVHGNTRGGRLVHRVFGQWLITASHHEKHHENYGCNFGLYFRFWDRLCSTDRGLTEKFE